MVGWNDRRNRDVRYGDTTPAALRRLIDQNLAETSDKPTRLLFTYKDGGSSVGYPSKSTEGNPAVVHNLRSPGGRPLRDEDLVRIEAARKSRNGSRNVLYTHPNYRD